MWNSPIAARQRIKFRRSSSAPMYAAETVLILDCFVFFWFFFCFRNFLFFDLPMRFRNDCPGLFFLFVFNPCLCLVNFNPSGVSFYIFSSPFTGWSPQQSFFFLFHIFPIFTPFRCPRQCPRALLLKDRILLFPRASHSMGGRL